MANAGDTLAECWGTDRSIPDWIDLFPRQCCILGIGDSLRSDRSDLQRRSDSATQADSPDDSSDPVVPRGVFRGSEIVASSLPWGYLEEYFARHFWVGRVDAADLRRAFYGLASFPRPRFARGHSSFDIVAAARRRIERFPICIGGVRMYSDCGRMPVPRHVGTLGGATVGLPVDIDCRCVFDGGVVEG